MFTYLVEFFDHASLPIVGFIAFVCYSLANKLVNLYKSPIICGVSCVAMIAEFVHLYAQAYDFSLQSLWQPLVRALAVGAVTLGAASVFTFLVNATVNRYGQWLRRALASKEKTKPPTVVYVTREPEEVDLPVLSPYEYLSLQVQEAQSEYQDTVDVLNHVASSLEEDEAGEIEMLAKQKLLTKLNDVLGGDDGTE
jgi:hypothetical protein